MPDHICDCVQDGTCAVVDAVMAALEPVGAIAATAAVNARPEKRKSGQYREPTHATKKVSYIFVPITAYTCMHKLCMHA